MVSRTGCGPRLSNNHSSPPLLGTLPATGAESAIAQPVCADQRRTTANGTLIVPSSVSVEASTSLISNRTCCSFETFWK